MARVLINYPKVVHLSSSSNNSFSLVPKAKKTSLTLFLKTNNQFSLCLTIFIHEWQIIIYVQIEVLLKCAQISLRQSDTLFWFFPANACVWNNFYLENLDLLHDCKVALVQYMKHRDFFQILRSRENKRTYSSKLNNFADLIRSGLEPDMDRGPPV